MSSLSQLSSTVKQVDEDSTEQFRRLNQLDKLKKGFTETCYSTAGLPYNMTGRIIGPRGCTIFVEPNYESIVKFKIWKAFQLIHCLLRIDPSGKDMVQAIQSDDFKFYESQVEIIKNCFTIQQPYHSDVNDLNAVSSNHYSVGKRFSVEMLKVLEKQMLTSHMNNLLALPMFRDIFSIPSPAVSGRVTNGCAKKTIQF
ncbi:hypothetical protein T03_17088 [Trichinella britovi]|uniref:Uncharacterized protein n=1 Tax=Trichinella britovi TaxID=45882 RepID=A0A0V1C855_TRIBR|nr:hypothetical protein T03_17088 [Trichinella britovi]